MEVGATAYRAQGSAFYSDGSASYYIEEGTLTQMIDPQGRRLVELYGSVYMPLDERWRATKAEALRDARDAVARHAERMRVLSAEIEQKAVAAEVAQ